MHKRIFGITTLMLLAVVFTAGSFSFVPLAAVAQEQAQANTPPQEALSVSHERLENLGELKQQVKRYYACTCDCGCYEKEAEA